MFTDYASKNPDTIKALMALQRKHGLLNIGKLEKEKFFVIERDEKKGLKTPISIHSSNEKHVFVGQINANNQIDGIGRKMFLDGTIIEGQFKNDKLNGFGRIMKTVGSVPESMIIGNFKDDMIMGYARKDVRGNKKEGLFEQLGQSWESEEPKEAGAIT